MLHTMHLDADPYKKIVNGSKTIELRLYDERRRKIKTGDTIEFASSKGTVRVVVVALHVFADFAELYGNLDLLKCGYAANELATASPNDMLRYYPLSSQRQWGVVGIEVRLLDRASR